MHDDTIGLLGIVAVIGTVAAVIVGLSMVGDPENDYATMCQNADYIRLDDSACDRGDGGSFIMFISTTSDYHAPAVGSRIDQSKITKSLPSGKTYQKGGISTSGGVVKSSPGIVRGGFGGKSSSSS